MEQDKPHVDPTPTKVVPAYGGEKQEDFEQGIRVASCISLGGGCLDRINTTLKSADQFVVSFMYRFNSPTLIRTLEEKYLDSQKSGQPMPIVVFLDYNQTYNSSFEGSKYINYVKRLMNSIPTSLVKLGSRSFHHKVTISKKQGEQAIVILGSANATYESDNQHSEDVIFVQSNKLAAFYLEEFEKLFRRDPSKKSVGQEFEEPQVKIFHEHRFQPEVSNIEALSRMSKFLAEEDQITLEGHEGDITTVALSTGHPEEGGNQRCLEVVTQALGNPRNNALFLFENYISLNEELKSQEIWQHLTSKTPKFIVVEDNKHNRGEKNIPDSASEEDEEPEETAIIEDELEKNEGAAALGSRNNKVLFFRPFTGQKFHHKLILQYFKNRDPIVYTGSFHISTSAVKKNSETIIGIRSQELADDVLASLLLNSGLGEKPQSWRFIADNPYIAKKIAPLFSAETESYRQTQLLKAAEQISLKTDINLKRYMDRLDRIRSEILTTASHADEQQEIEKYFDHYIGKFKENIGNAEAQVETIEELKTIIFTQENIYLIWEEYLMQLKKKSKPSIKGFFRCPPILRLSLKNG